MVAFTIRPLCEQDLEEIAIEWYQYCFFNNNMLCEYMNPYDIIQSIDNATTRLVMERDQQIVGFIIENGKEKRYVNKRNAYE